MAKHFMNRSNAGIVVNSLIYGPPDAAQSTHDFRSRVEMNRSIVFSLKVNQLRQLTINGGRNLARAGVFE